MRTILFLFAVLFSVAGFGQQQMLLRGAAAGGGANLLLDDYPGAVGAYSVRKLDKDYVGSAMRIERTSDNTQVDIGFDGNDLDEAAIISHCSGTACFVVTWYDQSGNANDATLSGAGHYVYNGGALLTEGGFVALKPISTAQSSYDTGLLLNGTTVFAVVNTTNYTGNAARIASSYDGAGGAAAEDFVIDVLASNDNLRVVNSGSFQNITSGGHTAGHRSYYFKLVPSLSIIAGWDGGNTNTGATYTSPGNTTRAVHLFEDTDGAIVELITSAQEIIFYNSDQSANRAGIDANINAYYSIY